MPSSWVDLFPEQIMDEVATCVRVPLTRTGRVVAFPANPSTRSGYL